VNPQLHSATINHRARPSLAERTTLNLPVETIAIMRSLSSRYRIPQAEIVRRSVDCSRFLMFYLKLCPDLLQPLKHHLSPSPATTHNDQFSIYLDPLTSNWLRAKTDPSSSLTSALHLYRSLLQVV